MTAPEPSQQLAGARMLRYGTCPTCGAEAPLFLDLEGRPRLEPHPGTVLPRCPGAGETPQGTPDPRRMDAPRARSHPLADGLR